MSPTLIDLPAYSIPHTRSSRFDSSFGSGAWLVVLLLAGFLSASGLEAQVQEQVVTRLTDEWSTVQLSGSYTNPVVIAGPPTHQGDNPGVVRLRNVGSGDVQARFQEWDYLAREHGDPGHAHDEIVPLLVAEAGTQEVPSGVTGPAVWEAGTFTLDGTKSWKSVDFSGSFRADPLLFLTIQTHNGPQAVTVRARNVGPGGFDAALFEEEALNDGHAQETVGYLAVFDADGRGSLDLAGDGATYTLGREHVNHQWTTWEGVDVMLEEEASHDPETTHGNAEAVALLEVDGNVYAQPTTFGGADPVAARARYDAGPAERIDRKPEARSGRITLDAITVDAAEDNNGDDAAYLAMRFEARSRGYATVEEVNWVKDLFVNEGSGYEYEFSRHDQPDGVIFDGEIPPYAVFGTCVAFFDSDGNSEWADVKRAFSRSVDQARGELDEIDPGVRQKAGDTGVPPEVRSEVLKEGIRAAERVADGFGEDLAGRESTWGKALKNNDDFYGAVCSYSANAPNMTWSDVEQLVSESDREHLRRPGTHEQVIGFSEGALTTDPPAPLIHNNQWTVEYSIDLDGRSQ